MILTTAIAKIAASEKSMTGLLRAGSVGGREGASMPAAVELALDGAEGGDVAVDPAVFQAD